MHQVQFNKKGKLWFHRFSNKSYALFAVLGREVLIGTLSVATLQHAKAEGISTDVFRAADSLAVTQGADLAEVSVTATRAPLSESQQARMVTVLSHEDIAQAPAQSVNDLLKYAAGIDVRQRGPLGAQTDVSVRGGNYEQIAVLLNGISVGDPQTGHNSVDFPVDLDDIERIEVLEGPAARVYGTSSLLGAINIVTRPTTHDAMTARTAAGSYGYAGTGLRASFGGTRWRHMASASHQRSDGYSRNKEGRLNADLKSTKAFYQGNYTDDDVTVDWHAGLSVKDFGSNTFYGASWDDQFEHTLKTYSALQASTRSGRLHLHPAVYWNHNLDRFELFRNAPDKYPYNYHRTDVFGLNLNTWLDWVLGRTAVGAEMRLEDMVSTTLGEPLDRARHIHGSDRKYTNGLDRTNLQLVLEHNVLLKRLTMSAGVTAVKNSTADMGVRVYPGADVSWRIGGGWKAYASWNSSLRMPSFTELYYSVGGHKADRHLKPEELSAVEIGARYASTGMQASAAAYYNHRRNLIDWVRDTRLGDDAVWQSVNYGHVNGIGLELSARADLLRLMPAQHALGDLSVSYSYISQDRDEEEGQQSRYVLEYLKHKLVATLGLRPARNVSVTLDYRLQHRTGTYTDTDGGVRRYGTYGVVDAHADWHAGRWSVFAEGNNLLGKHYVDYGSIPQPGVWAMAGVRLAIFGSTQKK